ncbi:complex I subunit 1 family protein [Conexibacter sp. DBS9H8]|uniref:complex I subunit 1 family protein n=1 Tax=Conexibacter sp. DBS9H8 TaxID=2937801 RepID=UPI00200E935E|nr:complex I subunit 1 family protein [Conexibacter sp. DBS9H8]
MSYFTPLAVVGLALAAAPGVWLLEQLVAGQRPAPGRALRDLRIMLGSPLQRPESCDSALFHLAPSLLVLASVVALATVPWAPGFRGIDLQAGALLFVAALAYVTPAMVMAGWGAGRPLAVLGGFRWVALMLAYAMPLAMVITSVAAPAGSLRPTDIVRVQHAVPMAVAQPLALALWLPAVTAVCFLPPFDLPQAGGELFGGVFAEYRGLDLALVALAQRVLLLAVSGMTAALFLAGWEWPLLPPAVWMGLKTAAVAWLLLWAGRRFPRVAVDRALSLAWRVANPLSMLAIVYAGLLTLLFYR